MTEPENESRIPGDEQFDALMKSFFDHELPPSRISHREISTIETNRATASSTRRILVLVVSALSLLIMSNVLWSPRNGKTRFTKGDVKIDPKTENGHDHLSLTPVSRPSVTRIPRIQNRTDKVILPEGQEFGRNFSQVDERREHVDSKTGTRLNITSEEFQIEIYEIPEKNTKSNKSSPKSHPGEKPKSKRKKNLNSKHKTRHSNAI